ncbi:MAG: N-acetylglucosamine-6-phosphate deacetylase [Fimbriiglobus sp.]|jgi:N-acetylglucosamine-6-phosphate deacetylase|nr:N-acetylglucosamine-6-phosphate deacetylase [Fimbriiglobus sp.]
MLIHARHFATGQSIAVSSDAGRVVSITDSANTPDGWIAPAFFDIQINGGHGLGFTNPALTPDHVRTIADLCRTHGIGGFCPTVITAALDTQLHAFRTLHIAAERDPELDNRIPAFHLEGPYISPDDGPRGAHPKAHARHPNWDEFRRLQDAAGGRIRILTMAPELPGAVTFIERVTAAGVQVSLGHTAATAAQIANAVNAGATLSTHLGNGCHATLPRHDNYIWEQLANDQLMASVIADGHHLPPAVLKSLIRGKTPGRVILTCDAGTFAGSAPGRYSDWGGEVEVLAGGKIVVPGTPFLAGSGVFTDHCVSGVLRWGGVSLGEAIEMASIHPRTLLGLPVPTLAVGGCGPFVLFDWQPGEEVTIRRVVG